MSEPQNSNPSSTVPSSGLYCLKDSVSESFSAPFVARSDRDALRQINHMLVSSDPRALHRTHARDFGLWRLCAWSEDRGIYQAIPENPSFLSFLDVLLPREESKK